MSPQTKSGMAQPFPIHALGPLEQAAREVADATQAPIEIAAASALSISSLAVQGMANVETLGGERPVSTFYMTVAKSGERKSSIDRQLSKPLTEHLKDRSLEFSRQMQAYEIEREEYDSNIKDIRKQKRSKNKDMAAGACADLAAIGSPPAPPLRPERVVTEPTYEGLVKAFDEGHGSLAIFNDEGGQFLGGHGMNKDNRMKTTAAFNSLWDGAAINRTRAGGKSQTLVDRRLSAHLMVQPPIASNILNDEMAESIGFTARFLIAQPPSKIGQRLFANAKPTGLGLVQFHRRIEDLLQIPQVLDTDNRTPVLRTLGLSTEAKAHLIEYADNVEMAQAPNKKFADITGTASKSAEQATRIAGVLTLFRDHHADEVPLDIMQKGTALADYYLNEFLRLKNLTLYNQRLQDAKTVRSWLLEKNPFKRGIFHRNELLQSVPLRRLRNLETLKPVIETMQENGWITPLPEGQEIDGVARKFAWKIVHDEFS